MPFLVSIPQWLPGLRRPKCFINNLWWLKLRLHISYTLLNLVIITWDLLIIPLQLPLGFIENIHETVFPRIRGICFVVLITRVYWWRAFLGFWLSFYVKGHVRYFKQSLVFLCVRWAFFLYLVRLLCQALCQRTSTARYGIHAYCIWLLGLFIFWITENDLVHESLLFFHFLDFLHLLENIQLISNGFLIFNVLSKIIEYSL